MRVTGTFSTLQKVWDPNTTHRFPKLYVCNPQGKVTSVFPIAGDSYEWILSDTPDEAEFLAHYGYSHRVDSVQS